MGELRSLPPAGVGVGENFFGNLLTSGSDWPDGSSVATSRCHWRKVPLQSLTAGSDWPPHQQVWGGYEKIDRPKDGGAMFPQGA